MFPGQCIALGAFFLFGNRLFMCTTESLRIAGETSESWAEENGEISEAFGILTQV